VYPSVPPQVEYSLTSSGRSLHGVLAQLVDWTEENLAVIQQARADFDAIHADRGEPGVEMVL
jgi:DNA-binding HxlR family transcriptional regulator